jgi:hypothetical protein
MLESPDEHLIGEIATLLVYGDRFYVLDSKHTKSVFCFSDTGKFLYEINREGRGPGEYTEIKNISIDYIKNKLLIYAKYSVLEFDLDGNYIDDFSVDFMGNDFSCIGNSYCAFAGDYTSNKKYETGNMTPNLLITEDYKVRQTDLFFPSKVNFGALTSNLNIFSNDLQGTLSMIVAYNDTIYRLKSDTVERAFCIDFENSQKDKNFYSLLYSPEATVDEINNYILNHGICNILGMTETQSHLFFIYNDKTKFHFVFYNKITKKFEDIYRSGAGMKFPFENDINGAPFMYPIVSDGQSFYAFLDAYIFKEFMSDKIDAELKNRFDNLSEYDNPVIIKMTPKN